MMQYDILSNVIEMDPQDPGAAVAWVLARRELDGMPIHVVEVIPLPGTQGPHQGGVYWTAWPIWEETGEAALKASAKYRVYRWLVDTGQVEEEALPRRSDDFTISSIIKAGEVR